MALQCRSNSHLYSLTLTGTGYYFYRAGGDPEAAKKKFEGKGLVVSGSQQRLTHGHSRRQQGEG